MNIKSNRKTKTFVGEFLKNYETNDKPEINNRSDVLERVEQHQKQERLSKMPVKPVAEFKPMIKENEPTMLEMLKNQLELRAPYLSIITIFLKIKKS